MNDRTISACSKAPDRSAATVLVVSVRQAAPGLAEAHDPCKALPSPSIDASKACARRPASTPLYALTWLELGPMPSEPELGAPLAGCHGDANRSFCSHVAPLLDTDAQCFTQLLQGKGDGGSGAVG